MYSGKIILAPMVRIGALPMRLLSLDYGADLVYTEELIDHKLLRCTRLVNGTIDFVDETDGTVVFRTCKKETDKLILQLGTCDKDRALKVAKLVESDVSGIDINMGCPKEFSYKGGMGVALMEAPDKATDILKTLVTNLSIPVTCKIRVFEDFDKTMSLCEQLEKTGISAIGIHGRTKHERPQHKNRSETIKKIAQHLSIPVIANGGSKEIESFLDIEKFREQTGSASVMLARAAEWNCSIFRKEGKLPIDEVIQSYLRYSVMYDNSPSNTKYCIQNMLRDLQSTPCGQLFLKAQTLEQFCDIWHLGNYCRLIQKKYRDLGLTGKRKMSPVGIKKLKLFHHDEKEIVTLPCAFHRKAFPDNGELPKQILHKFTRDKGLKQPVYSTIQENKLFRSVCCIDGKKYSSSYWEKNKKWAEHGAAIVSLLSLGLIDKDELIKSGCII